MMIASFAGPLLTATFPFSACELIIAWEAAAGEQSTVNKEWQPPFIQIARDRQHTSA
jgi:hypothetical protein